MILIGPTIAGTGYDYSMSVKLYEIHRKCDDLNMNLYKYFFNLNYNVFHGYSCFVKTYLGYIDFICYKFKRVLTTLNHDYMIKIFLYLYNIKKNFPLSDVKYCMFRL